MGVVSKGELDKNGATPAAAARHRSKLCWHRPPCLARMIWYVTTTEKRRTHCSAVRKRSAPEWRERARPHTAALERRENVGKNREELALGLLEDRRRRRRRPTNTVEGRAHDRAQRQRKAAPKKGGARQSVDLRQGTQGVFIAERLRQEEGRCVLQGGGGGVVAYRNVALRDRDSGGGGRAVVSLRNGLHVDPGIEIRTSGEDNRPNRFGWR